MRSNSKKIPRATISRWRWAWGLIKALGNMRGSNGIRVAIRPNVGIEVILDKAQVRSAMGEEFALVRLTAADATDAWKYVGEEVISTDPDADPPTWAVKSPGRTWGVDSEDEGLIVHPTKIEGLEETASGADAVYVVRRVVVDGGVPRWVIVGANSRRLKIEITDNEEINAGKFKYAWREVRLANDGTASVVDGGLSGTTSASWALNRREIKHTGTGYVGGVNIEADDYPDGFAPRPVGGGGADNTHKQNVIVDAEMIDGRVWFSEAMSHDGACAAP